MQAANREYNDVQREEAVNAHLPMVRMIARVYAKRVPQADYDDLVQEGCIGLLQAWERFDESRGVPFKQFCRIRVEGAIKDYLRGAFNIPRSIQQAYQEYCTIRAQLMHEHCRQVTDEEMSEALGLSIQGYQGRVLEFRRYYTKESLPDFESTDWGDEHVTPQCARQAENDQLQRLSRKEQFDQICEMAKRLSEREQETLYLHYQLDWPQKTIADHFGVNESRVSQINSRAIHKLQHLVIRHSRKCAA